MTIHFDKYHGTGNDFIIIDGMSPLFDIDKFTPNLVAHLCHRRFGIGADGLMILAPHNQQNFKMIYYNSDGHLSSMCGNGSRCLVDFAFKNRYITNTCQFEAVDGLHDAKVGDLISVTLRNVKEIEKQESDFILDTGSPHYVKFVDDVEAVDIIPEALKVRNSDRFKEAGINVNFVQKFDDSIFVRTYERGVEDETYSCGTGVVASAIASFINFDLKDSEIKIQTKGGNLKVSFDAGGSAYSNIWLTGPAVKVFSSSVEV